MGPHSVSKTDAGMRDPLQGVEGWLAWFCASCMLFTPLLTLSTVVNSKVDHFYLHIPLLEAVAVMIFAFVAGLFVAIQSSMAITVLRLYFGLLGSYSVFRLTFTVLEGGSIAKWDRYLQLLVSLGIWASYFQYSRRVRATFGRNLWS